MALVKFLKQVGSRIKETRRNAGLTQSNVAEKADIEIRYYQRIEAGKINLTLETLYILSKVLKVDVKQLF